MAERGFTEIMRKVADKKIPWGTIIGIAVTVLIPVMTALILMYSDIKVLQRDIQKLTIEDLQKADEKIISDAKTTESALRTEISNLKVMMEGLRQKVINVEKGVESVEEKLMRGPPPHHRK